MCSQKLSKIFFVFSVLFLLFAKKSFATAPQITAYPSGDIGLDQSFIVSATMSGLTKSAVYRLRIVLVPSGTSNYFGSTWNGSSWYDGSPSPINYDNFYSITTDTTGAWWGDVQGQVDADDPNFTTGGGTYDVKIGRYTQTGSTATWSNAVSITLVVPPTPTSTPMPLPTNTPILLTPTTKPTATNTPAGQASQGVSKVTPLSTPTIAIEISPTGIASFGAVLGTESATSPPEATHPTLVAAAGDTRKTVVELFPLVIIFVGFGLLASCGILVFFQSEKGKDIWKKFF